MAHFYGTLQGARGAASRLGHKSSGIRTCAASWSGAIRVEVYYNEETGKDMYRVVQTPWQGRGVCEVLAEGEIGVERATRKRKAA